jgi:hypothetical protein
VKKSAKAPTPLRSRFGNALSTYWDDGIAAAKQKSCCVGADDRNVMSPSRLWLFQR